MQKDLKIGMIAGLVFAAAAMIYISTRPSLSTRARMLKANQTQSQESPQQVITSQLNNYQQPAATSNETVKPDNLQTSYVEKNTPEKSEPQKMPAYKKYEQHYKIRTQKFHIVRKGETLSGIARRYYGSATKWPKIYNANLGVLENPNMLMPGTKIIIPD